MLSRWTTTSIRSSGSSKSQEASMTSRPLFIMVAESMVIFAPMSQLGWRKACSRVTVSSSSRLLPKNGPPDAVRINFSRASRPGHPCKHWKIAECSLSTGRIFTPCCRASSITMAPPATRVSLLARARVFPARMAAKVG